MEQNITVFKLEGTSDYEMGYKQGNTFKGEIHQMYKDLTNSEEYLASKPRFIPKFLFIRIVNSMSSKKIKEAINSYCPLQWKFLEGLRDGADMKIKKLLFLQALDALGTQIQDYKRTNENLTVNGCSAAGVTGNRSETRKPLIIKNWDGPETLAKYIFFRQITHSEKNRYSTLSSGVVGLAGINNGINEEGLSIVYNYAYPKNIGNEGLPPMFLIRKALERCRSLSETLELFKESPRLGGANIMIGDQNGNLVVAEMGASKISVRNLNNQDHSFLICTNHYLSPEMRELEIPRYATYDKNAPFGLQGELIHKSSLLRYKDAYTILENQTSDKITLGYLNRKIQTHHGPDNNPSRYTFCNHGENISTGFGIMLDVKNKRFHAVYGKPCQGTMQSFSL